jgi:hypothetical protein
LTTTGSVESRGEAQISYANPAEKVNATEPYNDPGQAALVFNSDFGAALEEPSPQHYGRSYLTYWEVRNLRMAANIHEAMSPPGMRMLVVVGASHKFYLEAYLNQMHDVRIVDPQAVLRNGPIKSLPGAKTPCRNPSLLFGGNKRLYSCKKILLYFLRCRFVWRTYQPCTYFMRW